MEAIIEKLRRISQELDTMLTQDKLAVKKGKPIGFNKLKKLQEDLEGIEFEGQEEIVEDLKQAQEKLRDVADKFKTKTSITSQGLELQDMADEAKSEIDVLDKTKKILEELSVREQNGDLEKEFLQSKKYEMSQKETKQKMMAESKTSMDRAEIDVEGNIENIKTINKDIKIMEDLGGAKGKINNLVELKKILNEIDVNSKDEKGNTLSPEQRTKAMRLFKETIKESEKEINGVLEQLKDKKDSNIDVTLADGWETSDLSDPNSPLNEFVAKTKRYFEGDRDTEVNAMKAILKKDEYKNIKTMKNGKLFTPDFDKMTPEELVKIGDLFTSSKGEMALEDVKLANEAAEIQQTLYDFEKFTPEEKAKYDAEELAYNSLKKKDQKVLDNPEYKYNKDVVKALKIYGKQSKKEKKAERKAYYKSKREEYLNSDEFKTGNWFQRVGNRIASKFTYKGTERDYEFERAENVLKSTLIDKSQLVANARDKFAKSVYVSLQDGEKEANAMSKAKNEHIFGAYNNRRQAPAPSTPPPQHDDDDPIH